MRNRPINTYYERDRSRETKFKWVLMGVVMCAHKHDNSANTINRLGGRKTFANTFFHISAIANSMYNDLKHSGDVKKF